MKDIQALRNDTPGCHGLVHLNNAGASLMPAPVTEAIQEYIRAEAYQGGYETADSQAASLDEFYRLSAALLDTHPRNTAFTTSATDGYNRALSSIPFKPGDTVLISGNDYPSNYMAFISLQKRYGIRFVTIRNAATGEIDLNDLEEKLKLLQPRLVSLSHVPTSSGLVQPAEGAGALIKHYHAWYLLDACQSLGQLPVSAAETRADFITGTFRKFLRGPRGAGLLYVSDEALEAGLEPLMPDIRGGEWLTMDTYRSRPDAKRFESWERAPALVAGSREALAYLLSLGIHNIVAFNKALHEPLRHSLQQLGRVRLLDRGQHLCSIVTFSVDGISKERAMDFFHARHINIYTTSRSSALADFQEKGVDWVFRASPHYYNTRSEIDFFTGALAEMLDQTTA